MRILQIGPVPVEAGGRSQGGIASHVWDLSRQLARNGHKVAILGDNVDHTDAHPRICEGIQIFGLYNIWQALLSTRWLNLQFWRKFRFIWHHFDGSLQGRISILGNLASYLAAVANFKPDIIHVHRLQIEFVYAHAVSGEIPLVATAHSASAIELMEAEVSTRFRILIEKNLALAGPVIFVSHFVEQQYSDLFPEHMPQVDSRVIHNPVQAEHFRLRDRQEARQRIQQPEKKRVIFSAGMLRTSKRFDVLIEVVAEIKRETPELPLVLLIAGAGPLRKELEQQIKSLGASDYILLEGERSQQELVDYYNAADVFVLASEMESFGLVYLEAMLCGCPVIGTPAVMAEILPDEGCGFHLPLSDKLALKRAILDALHRDWNRQAIRQCALQFDWQQRLGQFEEVYQQTVNTRVQKNVRARE